MIAQHNKCIKLVLDTIRFYASEDSPIDASVIHKRIMKDPDNVCERKTISRALKRLRLTYGKDEEGEWLHDNIHLHYTVVARSSAPIYKNYWLEEEYEEEFSDEEIFYLMDSVIFSRHISKKHADDLIKKLKKLSRHPYAAKFNVHRQMGDSYHTVKKDLFLNLDRISEALVHKSKISFFNNEYALDKKLHRTEDAPIIVNPYQIVLSDGNYYLLCGKDGSAVEHYRIDRMTDVVILQEQAISSHYSLNGVQIYPEKYLYEHRYMNVGKAVEVVLSIEKKMIGEVIDSFGTRFTVSDAEDNKGMIEICVKSSEKDIIEWCTRFGAYAEILSPEYLRREMENRAFLLANSYIHEDPDIYYQNSIKKAKATGELYLHYIDLNQYDSFKRLSGISRINLRHNRIKDFSFLNSFPELTRLVIGYNEIQDPNVISELHALEFLGLVNTSIADLGFLKEMDHLQSLSLLEYGLKNIEAIYALPNLKSLIVNRSVASLINQNKLGEAMGNGFRYMVRDYYGNV